MMSVIITTYGREGDWRDLAVSRARPSVEGQIAGDDEIVVHHEDDLAIGPARNAAAAQSRGDWLVFLDADDELEHGYLAAMRAAANRAENATWTLYQPSVSYVRKGRPAPPYLIPRGDLRQDNFLVVGTMISREVFDAAGGFEDLPHGFEDFSLWAKAWKAGATVATVPRAVYRAHVNPNSKHRTMWRRRSEQLYWHLYTQHLIFPDEFPVAPTPPPGMVLA